MFKRVKGKAHTTAHGGVTGTVIGGLMLSVIAGCSSGSSAESKAGATTTATTLNIPFVGDPASPWCQQVSNVGSAGLAVAQLDMGTATPDQIKARYDTLVAALQTAAPDVPPEIEAQVTVYTKDVTEYRDLLAKSNFNIANVNAPRLQELTEEINATGAIVDKYNRDVCFGGVSINTAPAGSAPAATTTPN